MAPLAIPAAVAGGSALINYFQNRGTKKAEKAALGEQTAGAVQARTQGAELYKTALPQLQQAGNYYSTLVGGNRAQLTAAMQPETRQITDAYRGASANLERAGVRGATRDLAEADIGRERAGRIAGLVPSLRPNAAAGLSALSSGTMATSRGLSSGATATFGDLAQGYQRQNYINGQQQHETGQDIGKILQAAMNQSGSKKGSGSGLTYTSGIQGSTLPGSYVPIPK